MLGSVNVKCSEVFINLSFVSHPEAQGRFLSQFDLWDNICGFKSGLMNKDIVKHIVGLCGTIFHFWCPVPV